MKVQRFGLRLPRTMVAFLTEPVLGAGEVAMPMTQHYLCGELSSRLAQLERTATGHQCELSVRQLRRDAELATPFRLRAIARRALELADLLCWNALQQGRVTDFVEEATIAADLHEFALCANLFAE